MASGWLCQKIKGAWDATPTMKNTTDAAKLFFIRVTHLDDILAAPSTANMNCPRWLQPRENETADQWLGHLVDEKMPYSIVRPLKMVRLEHLKEQTTLLHEYCIATIYDTEKYPDGEPGPDQVIYIRFDRLANTDDLNWKERMRPKPRTDQVKSLNREIYDTLKEQALLIKTLSWPPNDLASILDLAVVAEQHSVFAREYFLFSTMCYWFAGHSYETLAALYPSAKSKETKHTRRGGTFYRIPVYRGKVNSTELEENETSFRSDMGKPPMTEEEAAQLRELASSASREDTGPKVLQLCRDRRTKVVELLKKNLSAGEEREGKEREREAKEREREAKEREREAKEREREAKEREREGRKAAEVREEREREGRKAAEAKILELERKLAAASLR